MECPPWVPKKKHVKRALEQRTLRCVSFKVAGTLLLCVSAWLQLGFSLAVGFSVDLIMGGEMTFKMVKRLGVAP